MRREATETILKLIVFDRCSGQGADHVHGKDGQGTEHVTVPHLAATARRS